MSFDEVEMFAVVLTLILASCMISLVCIYLFRFVRDHTTMLTYDINKDTLKKARNVNMRLNRHCGSLKPGFIDRQMISGGEITEQPTAQTGTYCSKL